jgi:protein O-mannosyl-transferase
MFEQAQLNDKSWTTRDERQQMNDNTTEPHFSAKHVWVFWLVLLASCIAVYLPGLSGALFFDDVPNLIANRYLQFSPAEFDGWRSAVLSNDSGILHRPVSMFTFAVNSAVAGGVDAYSFKAVNLLIHLLIGVVVYALSRALLQAPALGYLQLDESRTNQIALLAAGVWLLHPLHVSTVLYAVQRMAQLSALFVCLALLLYARLRCRWATNGATTGDVIAAGLWILLATLAAMLSKENGVLVPWLILVVEVFLFRGVWNGRENPRLQRAGWILLLLPVLIVCLVFLLSPDVLDARYARREFSLQERLLTQTRLLWHYVYWLVVPDITSMGFHHDDIALSKGLLTPVSTLVAILAWAVAVAAAFLARHKYPLVAFALFFFLIAHSMESSFWPLEMAYEHRNYLPAIAWCLLLAVIIDSLSKGVTWLRFRVVGVLVLVAFVLPLGVRTSLWADEISLARHNVLSHPDSPRANFFYANAIFKALDDDGEPGLSEKERGAYLVTAREYYLRMHKLDPRDFAPMVMLHQIESSYFPTLPEREDWLGKLKALAATRKMQASDRTALNALVDATVARKSEAELAQVNELIETLLIRYSNRPYLQIHKSQLQGALDDQAETQIEAYLLLAKEKKPYRVQTYPYLVNHYGSRDIATSYELLGEWMKHDKLKRDLLSMKRVLKQ